MVKWLKWDYILKVFKGYTKLYVPNNTLHRNETYTFECMDINLISLG